MITPFLSRDALRQNLRAFLGFQNISCTSHRICSIDVVCISLEAFKKISLRGDDGGHDDGNGDASYGSEGSFSLVIGNVHFEF